MAIQEHRVYSAATSGKAIRDAAQWSAPAAPTCGGHQAPSAASTICPDPDKTGEDLVRLVLVVVETVRQLVERQAIRRVESGTLSEEEVERLGLALMRLEERMAELKEHFNLSDDDLALRLGPFHELAEEVRDE